MNKPDEPKPRPQQPVLQRRLADAYEVTIRPDADEASLAATLAHDLRHVVTTAQDIPQTQAPGLVTSRLPALLNAMPASPLADTLRPLAQITQAVETVERGAPVALPSGVGEIGVLSAAFERRLSRERLFSAVFASVRWLLSTCWR